MGRHERIPTSFGPRVKCLLRRGNKAEWNRINPILREREVVWESDTDRFKVGDGVSPWTALDYYQKVEST